LDTELSDDKDIQRQLRYQYCGENKLRSSFPDVQMQLKTYFFVPFVRPRMHHNYGVISGSHACRDCVWHIILDVVLYTTCPGKRVLVATRFNVTFLPLRLLRKYTYLFLERCRKSNNTWLRALMQSDCLYSSLFFEHYNHILLCELVIELCSIRLNDGVSCHKAFAFHLDSTNIGIGALLRSSFVTSVTR